MVHSVQHEFTAEKVNKAVSAILDTLGEPQADLHKTALEAFQRGDHATVKRLASMNLNDNFCKSLGYLGGALKLTPNTDTILAESARAACEHLKEKHLVRLGIELGNALG